MVAQGNIPKTGAKYNNDNSLKKYLLLSTVFHQGSVSRVCRGLLDLHLRFTDLIRYVMGLLRGFKQGPNIQIQKDTKN